VQNCAAEVKCNLGLHKTLCLFVTFRQHFLDLNSGERCYNMTFRFAIDIESDFAVLRRERDTTRLCCDCVNAAPS
jgi:hypothetical protein